MQIIISLLIQLRIFFFSCISKTVQVALVVKNPPDNAGSIKRHGFNLWVRKIPRRRAWQPTPVFLPGESHGQKSLAGYGPWDHKELDTTEHISTHIHSGNKRYS